MTKLPRLIVAPMAGVTTPELVAASCFGGALGSLPGAYLSPTQLQSAIRATRKLTSEPFAVNLFAPSPTPSLSADDVARALAKTRPYRLELNLTTPILSPPFSEDFEAQLQVVLDERPAFFSYVFGVLSPQHMRALSQRNIRVIGAATTLQEALVIEASGADAVVVQGVEAGGHRAIHSPHASEPNISTLDLVAQASGKLAIPIIASGGLMTAADIQTALSAGAYAAQLGTAFLQTREAATAPAYRQALQDTSRRSVLTRAFSGRLARGLENRFVREMQGHHLPFPAMNALTRDIRTKASAIHHAELLSLWAGTNFALMTRDEPARQLVAKLLPDF